jgi:Mrp family chromosome partitioning ATPase
MLRLLELARAQYDLVVIDTPPLTGITDAASIAAIVDGVILVVREGVTDRPELELTLRRLARVNGRIMGVVFNDAHGRDGQTSRHQYTTASRAGAAR